MGRFWPFRRGKTLYFVNDGGPGEVETVLFDWGPGSDLGVIVSALAAGATGAAYDLRISAQPIPVAPLPTGPQPKVLAEHPEIARLKATGASFEDLLAALQGLREKRSR